MPPDLQVRIQPEPFDPGALLSAFCAGRTGSGAVVSFTGIARDHARDGAVTALELESYPGFTEAEIARRCAEVQAEFALHDLAVVHRVGRIAPGEAIVFVAAAAEHRRAAFQAADALMDWLKTSAPFWKKEHTPEGARWIEPRPEDHQDAARWTEKTPPP